MYKQGHKLDELAIMMGDMPRFPRPGVYPAHSRPNIQFICHRDQHGNVIVEDDVTDSENERPMWDSYFQDKPLYRVQLWQQNLAEAIVAEEEAHRVLAEAENALDGDDVDSLFGDS